jgi:hypothetical protein
LLDCRFQTGNHAGARCQHCGHAPRRPRRRNLSHDVPRCPKPSRVLSTFWFATGPKHPTSRASAWRSVGPGSTARACPGYEPATAQTLRADGNGWHGQSDLYRRRRGQLHPAAALRQSTKGRMAGKMPRVSPLASR